MLAVREHLAELHDSTGTSAALALITFTAPDAAMHYREHLELPFPVLVDAERAAYRDFGLGRGSVARVWGWRALKRYAEIIRESGLAELRAPTEDTLQLGGDFLVDREGRLAWGYWGEGPDDRPSVEKLTGALSRLS